MIVTIHQPEHMPWTGFFHKMQQADTYVLLDNVQFTKNNWQNRNKIVDRSGVVHWLTAPVLIKGHISTTINAIKINSTSNWQRKYWGRIRNAYCRHPHFNQLAPELEHIVCTEHSLLVNLNYRLIDFFRKHLGITTRLVRASELSATGTGSERLLNICTELQASQYISGPDGKKYLTLAPWEEAGIDIVFHQYSPVKYAADNYIPGLSTLDLLMNHGPDSARILGTAQ